MIWLVPRTRLNKIFYDEKVVFDHIGNPFLTKLFASRWLEITIQKKPATTWAISEYLELSSHNDLNMLGQNDIYTIFFINNK